MTAKDDIDDSSAPLVEHLAELRNRLIWAVATFLVAMILCFVVAEPILDFLLKPIEQAMRALGNPNPVMQYTAPQEYFFTLMHISVVAGLMLSFPVIAYQLWRFVAPGLYRTEKQAFLPFLIASPILFLIGAGLVYFFFTPMVMWFFLAMEQGGGEGQVSIQLLPKVSEYLGLIMSLIFAFGLVFQLPVISSLLVRSGFITSQTLAEKRKYAIVIAFVVAAVLTPPDPVSQIGLALPAILLYEISIYTARLIERQRARASEAQDAENEVAATPDEAD